MSRFRPVSKFHTYTHQALCDWSQGITTALTGSLVFSTPPISIADQTAANNAFHDAIEAWGPLHNRGSEAQHGALMAARAVVEDNIRSLMGYVNGIANGDRNLILSAGMIANDAKTPFGTLPAPQNLRSPFSKHTVPGQVRLRWKKVKGAKSYNVYTAASETDPYVFLANATSTLFIASGNPGTPMYYKVAAVGAKNVIGDMSDLCKAYFKF